MADRNTSVQAPAYYESTKTSRRKADALEGAADFPLDFACTVICYIAHTGNGVALVKRIAVYDRPPQGGAIGVFRIHFGTRARALG